MVFEKCRGLSVHINKGPFGINNCMKVQLIGVSMQIALLYAIDFLLHIMIKYWAKLKVYLSSLIVQWCNCSSLDAIEF